MRLLKSIVVCLGLIIFISPGFAVDNMACCEQLRQEVKMLKDQQDKMFNKLAQQESMDKKGLMTSIGALVETLANKFPDLKDGLKKIKTTLDTLANAHN